MNAKIERFYDEDLAHASYTILSSDEIVLIDPARNPQPYYDFAKKHNANIIAVIETHLHADFVSSHLQIQKEKGAVIYASKFADAKYSHISFDQDDVLALGKIELKALNTPGHSPDSICILLLDEQDTQQAVFTGDTLFVGDVGRPDLREEDGDLATQEKEMARQMYFSTRNVLMKLGKDVEVYPAHGAGSLCGKNISSDLSSTIGRELKRNPALQPMDEDTFIDFLLEDQPFIPKYFKHDVSLNRNGADSFEESINSIPLAENETFQGGIAIIDARSQQEFKSGHHQGAINIAAGGKFETWLGTILSPKEPFYLVAENKEILKKLLEKTAKIGYEKNIKAALTSFANAKSKEPQLDVDHFKSHKRDYQILDVRNDAELENGKIFKGAIHIPLPELEDGLQKIDTNKSVVVHCASGYRSAIAASLIKNMLPDTRVYDLGTAVKNFKSD
ncbi:MULTISPECIES: MBL fold metallo-hydrolase [Christiangramia]|uniref:Metallo-beta-lactamase superfamily protein n=1 Tax=Christiangramia flava JLT2011 TaxID=1229726 RepID=A0A1L7IAL9_9FLAO|nr:MBL fold metallo-hydrolase [Christiangramia flava]APU70172.1 Metallo-beta-lactamase superfamily protein [Christiangramia flava JLT2011]OSS39659.1 Rhodanese-like protein [Christiangramia flava JLT2011]